MDDCPQSVFVTDRETQIVMVNGAAARLLGNSTRELQRLTIWDITHVSAQRDFDVLGKEFLRAGRQRGNMPSAINTVPSSRWPITLRLTSFLNGM